MTDYEYRLVRVAQVNALLAEGWEPNKGTEPVYVTERSLNRAYDETTTYVYLRRPK